MDPKLIKTLSIVIAALLAIAATFGITVDVPVVDPTFPVE